MLFPFRYLGFMFSLYFAALLSMATILYFE
uniref:Uncharacterized protein n=1 Tax=Rhizophora mucronata TaxID=61149 RepID=A0A2P2N6W7_RHIMU